MFSNHIKRKLETSEMHPLEVIPEKLGKVSIARTGGDCGMWKKEKTATTNQGTIPKAGPAAGKHAATANEPEKIASAQTRMLAAPKNDMKDTNGQAKLQKDMAKGGKTENKPLKQLGPASLVEVVETR